MKELLISRGFAMILLIAGGMNLHAQEDYNFQPDRGSYIIELKRFFDSYGNKDSNPIVASFSEYTNETELEENEWVLIAEISNIIAGRQNNPYLYMSSFIKALTSFSKNPDRARNFQVWSIQVQNLLLAQGRKMKPLEEFFGFTENLHNKYLLYSTPTVSWKISSQEYTFLYSGDFYVRTGRLDLTGYAGADSSRIQSTRGQFHPSSSRWTGSGGKISWEKVGLDNATVFINLPVYSLDLSKSVFSIDSVNLIDRRHFNSPLLGRFEDKISIGVRPERSGYPRFSSYGTDYMIKSIFRDMDYRGGYSLEGLKRVGSGLGEDKGELLVFKDENPFMELESRRYVFDDEGAKSIETEVAIYIDSDSIIHPGLFFQYKKDKNELLLMRDGTGSSNSRFFDSFHQLTLDVEMMTWYPGDSLLYLSGMLGSLENIAVFESADYYSISWFNEIQVADLRNPLVMVKKCADYSNSRYYYSTDLAAYMKRPLHLVEEMLLNVSYQGFVRFDTETRLVRVLQRTYDFLNQHAGLMDYDIIRFSSNIEPPNPNAIINLRTGSMEVLGVPAVDLSDTRFVSFYPSQQKLTIDRGRDMAFDGTVQAGLLRFEGSDFIFNYQDFQIHLNTVDIIRLKVHIPLLEDYQETMIADLSSVIEDTRGLLRIDSPENKAGLEPEKTPQFPQFRFDTTAYVYYDQKAIQNGAYTRDSFFFEIDPNLLVGLNDVRFREKLYFPGTFFTHNIFPAIDLDLDYRDDNSLGFDTLSTPLDGYPVYVDRGTFYNEISMNTRGLRGKGTLEYLGSTIESENFLFLPDRVKIDVQRLVVDKNSSGLGNPDIFGQNLTATWLPKGNRMEIEYIDEALSIYENGQFKGILIIEPESIRADGKLEMQSYSLTSNELTFMEDKIDMEDGQLVIQSRFQDRVENTEFSEEPDFIANHVTGSVDLVNRMAEFSGAEGQATRLMFPVNKYTSDQSSFVWDMDNDRIFLENSTLTTSRKDQGDLGFKSGKSIYDINAYTIEANEVTWLDVADVRIFPGNEQVFIRANAVLDTLMASRVISRDTVLGHEFRNAVIKVNGINNYSGSGYYVYEDITGRELLLPFYEIGASSGRTSRGKAKVDSLAPFDMSPEFAFVGNVEWENNEKYLEYKGSYRLTYNCPGISKQWVRMDTRINPDNIIIPVDSISRSLDGNTLHHGFFISNQPVELYSAFLGPRLNYTDQPVLSTFGEISYDYENSRYKISKPENTDTLSSGSLLYLNNMNCINSGQGKLDFGLDLGQVNMEAHGRISHSLTGDSIYTDQILAVDFFLDQDLLDYFVNTVNGRGGLEPVNYSRPEYQRSIISWLGKERGQEILNELGLIGSFRKIPDEFDHTIFFTDLKLKWNPVRGSYQSVGKIGIGNINDQPVNKLVNGHLELVKRRSGDTFTLYVEFGSNAYFYFYYNRGLMQVLAGPPYEEFNNIVRDIKPRKRRLSGGLFRKLEGPQYEFALGQLRLVRNFLDDINANNQ